MLSYSRAKHMFFSFPLSLRRKFVFSRIVFSQKSPCIHFDFLDFQLDSWKSQKNCGKFRISIWHISIYLIFGRCKFIIEYWREFKFQISVIISYQTSFVHVITTGAYGNMKNCMTFWKIHIFWRLDITSFIRVIYNVLACE